MDWRDNLTLEQLAWEDSLPRIPGLFPGDDDQPDYLASEFDYWQFTGADISRMWASGDPEAQGLGDHILDHHRENLMRDQNEMFFGREAAEAWCW